MQVNENIIKIVRNVLNEEFGINQEVYDASNEVFDMIKSDLKHNCNQSDLKGVNGKIYTNIIKYPIHGKEVKVLYRFYYFDTKEDYLAYRKDHHEIVNAETNVTNNSDEFLVKVNYVVYDNVLDDMIFDCMQHELSHAFQQIISGKKYSYGKVRQNIERIPKQSFNDKEIRCANFILYMSREFEQDAFVNGLYASLMNGNEDLDSIGAIHNLKQLKGAIRMLSSCQDDNKFNSNFGINRKRIIQNGLKSVERLKNKINRVIFKYAKDTGKRIGFIG